jgi:demethylmenaquinone methyltransferase/2-methoxy-6-polyprenyl-1,4-benzoquinol methylase
VAWLIQRVQALSGFAPARRDCTWISAFQPQRELCSAYHRGRVILCGDAAHVMSPIGGQGMNVGFADAHFLANTLHGILREGRPFGAALRQYGRVRRRDFRVAAARAAAGMWVGTRRGITARARSVLFRHLLKRDSIQHFLADSFSMLNLPGRTGNSKWSDTKDCAVRLASAFESKENRREVNRRIFSIVAPRYALITRLLSFGRDSAWKRRLIGELPDLRQPACADLACGNGDLTTRLLQKYPDATVTGIDQSPEMLATARTGICSERVSFREADLLDTGLADASCDVVTAGYALRNAPDLVTAIAEVARLLKPGGRFALLDFSRSPHPVVARTQYLLLWLWGGWWGLVLHGNPSLYGYIAASLMRFPDRKRLRYLLEAHGLRPIRVRRGFGGMVETVQCEKMGDGSP